MAIGIDDLYDEDDIIEQPQEEEEVQNTYSDSSNNEDDEDVMSDYLKSKGIDDMSRIKFEGDDGNIEERDWNSLSKEEKLNILNTPLQEDYNIHEDNYGLTNEEIELINQIRSSNLSPDQYISQFKSEPQEPFYKVDDLSDDEIFILDLESRVGELSDEDAAQALSVAKQNDELYKKQVEGIRKEYQDREDFQAQQQQYEVEQMQAEALNQYQQQIGNAISSFNSIGNLDLNFDDQDREELAEFMLSLDQSGNNYFYKAMQDPDTLVKAAWFILNGEDAFNNITDYFTNQIRQVSEAQYKKGLEDGKSGKPSKSTVVINKTKQTSQKPINSIYNLDDDDE